MRPRFNPVDGQLYVAGLKGWQTNATREGGFDRVRYTGKPVHMPTGLRAKKTGMEIVFTNRLDKAMAEDTDNWSIQIWNYRWSSSYGSETYLPLHPKRKGLATLNVTSASLASDEKTVFLKIPDMQTVMQMKIKFRIKAKDGSRMRHEIYNTIHELAE